MGVKVRSYQQGGGGGAAVALAILTSAPLPAAVVAVPYTGGVSATGGTLPYAWTVSAGALPTGLTLDAVTGAITGVPTVAGTFPFSLTVTDAAGTVFTLPATMTALAAPAASSFTDDFNRANGFIGMNYLCVGHSPGSLFNIGSNQLLVASSGTTGQEGAVCIAAPGLWGSPSQYIKMRLISVNADARIGPALYIAGDAAPAGGGLQSYFAYVLSGIIHLQGMYPGVLNYQVQNSIGAPVAGDILEMQVDIGVGSNRVRFWQNAALLADVADANPNRPIAAGYPGLAGTGNAGASQVWDDLEIRATR